MLFRSDYTVVAWQDPNNESRSIQNNSELLEPEKFVTPGVREGIHANAGCNHWCEAGPRGGRRPVAWEGARFSWWMTRILHRFPGENPFDYQRQLADLDYIAGSKAAMTSLAKNYVGLPLEVSI